MALRDHVTPRMTVPLLAGNTVSVRGINLDDFMALLPDHMEAATKIAALYGQHKESVFSTRAFTDFLIAAARDFPGMISEVISIAADEPDTKDIKLSSGLQLSVLTAIMKMTIEEVGGLGNLFAQIRDVGARVVAAQQDLAGGSPRPRPSKSSTGPGGSK